jgi:sec-independent protein translocase protein TatC
MSLLEHLQELRSRLLKCTYAVIGFGIVSLIFAKPIFGILMKPVLRALPAEGRSLIYTSGIEEINVLMKVGLYCGIFLTTPVILWQIWGFVSPGLYVKEKKLAAPFVLLGSLAFMAGAVFCYFVLLPTMFEFLLNDSDAMELSEKLDRSRIKEQDALRFLRLGEAGRANDLAKAGSGELGEGGQFQIGTKGPAPQMSVELGARLEGMGRIIDALEVSMGPASRGVLQRSLEERLKAAEQFTKGNYAEVSKSLEQAAETLNKLGAPQAAAIAGLWNLEKQLAAAKTVYDARNWTRPMLTMREQLSLVLLLELAFGIIFELPLIMAVLAMVGLIKASFLMKYQRHAIVVCLIAAAIITPTGDAVNLALMAVPMALCYELGVLAAWIIEKRRAKAAATAALTTTTAS